MTIAVSLFDQLMEGEEKRVLNNKEITSLLLYRYHLNQYKKDENYKRNNVESFKKISAFILDNDLDDDDLPKMYDTYDDSLIKIMVRELNGGRNKSKRINNRKRYS